MTAPPVTGEQHAPGIVTKADVEAIAVGCSLSRGSEGFGCRLPGRGGGFCSISPMRRRMPGMIPPSPISSRAPVGNHVLCGIGRHGALSGRGAPARDLAGREPFVEQRYRLDPAQHVRHAHDTAGCEQPRPQAFGDEGRLRRGGAMAQGGVSGATARSATRSANCCISSRARHAISIRCSTG